MQKKILQILKDATQINDITLDKIKDEKFGDYSINTAMVQAKKLCQNPRQLAQELVEKINAFDKSGTFKKVEIAGPGFINLFICEEVISDNTRKILATGSEYGVSNIGEGQKVLIEYVSANPTGPLHIGHGRWAALGSAIASIMKTCGYSVDSEFYVNNVGKQIDMLLSSVKASALNEPTPEGGYGGAYIKDIALKVAQVKPDDLKKYILDSITQGQKEVLSKSGANFDRWFFESELHDGDKVGLAIKRLKDGGHTYEKDGATWFRSETFGDDKDRVLRRENSVSTYFAADIAYHSDKFDRGYDMLINIWGTDHHGYVKRLESAMSALGYPDGKLKILLGQLVTLFRGAEPVRMSKRTGEMITFEEVLDEIGPDATRFFLLMTGADTHVDFDLDLAKSQSMENPVYYVQYAHARICNIISNAGVELTQKESIDYSKLADDSERQLGLKLADYPSELEKTCKSLEPHHLLRYGRELSAMFHSYYHRCRVITEDTETSMARLALVDAARIVLSNMLKLLQISAPERM